MCFVQLHYFFLCFLLNLFIFYCLTLYCPVIIWLLRSFIYIVCMVFIVCYYCFVCFQKCVSSFVALIKMVRLFHALGIFLELSTETDVLKETCNASNAE